MMNVTLEQLYLPIRDALDCVRAEVVRSWEEALSLVDGAADALPGAQGKLLRPALCLMAAGACGAPDLERFIPLAVACELLHTAALTHDDIVDQADLRRGGASLNAVWDDRAAVLGGDYLVARAVQLLVSMGSCALIGETFGAVRAMTEGELRNVGRDPGQSTVEDCLRLAEDKTATYFAITCTTPTYLLGGEWREALRRYGIGLGIAFQLVDDILDIAQNQTTLGKPSCGDVAEGKGTIPVIFMREGMDAEDTAIFARMFGQPLTDEDRTWLAGKLHSTGARTRAEAIARKYADEARTALGPMPDSPYKNSMLGMLDFVLVRGA